MPRPAPRRHDAHQPWADAACPYSGITTTVSDLVARDDNLIPAAAQRFMAQRAGARTVEVRASHVAMMAQPRATADLIALAARAGADQRP